MIYLTNMGYGEQDESLCQRMNPVTNIFVKNYFFYKKHILILIFCIYKAHLDQL